MMSASSDNTSISAPGYVRGDQTSMILSAVGETSSDSSNNYILQAKIVQVTWDNVDMVKEVTPILNDENR